MVHQNFKHVKGILGRNNIVVKGDSTFCNSCIQGKHHRDPFPVSTARANEVCALIHIDLCGPVEEPSLNGSRYMFLLKDDYSSFKTVYFLNNKYEEPGKLL